MCKKNADLISPPINLDNIAFATGIKNKEIVKTCIKRTIKKEIISRTNAKTGRGGWSKFKFPQNVYTALYELHKEGTNREQTGNKQTYREVKDTNKEGTKQGTNLSSSSNNITNINTTTGLDENYSQVQIPKILKENNFSVNIIKQVQDRNYLSANDLQTSLEAFAFDITTNNLLTKKKINSAVSYFMGIVKNKFSYSPPSNFKSDADKARQTQQTRLEELKKQRLEATRIADELALEEWLYALSDSKKLQIAPEHGIFKLGTALHDLDLKAYYKKMIKGEVKLVN